MPLSALQGQTLSSKLAEEPATSLVATAREDGSVVRGAILFANKNLACGTCHAQGATDLVGPDLTALDASVTDEQLLESLLQPSKVIRAGFEQYFLSLEDGSGIAGRLIEQNEQQVVLRPAEDATRSLTIPRDAISEVIKLDTSAMPANLVDQLESRQQFLDLLRYVMHLRELRPANLAGSEPQLVREAPSDLQGRVLIEQYHCAACHLDLARELGFAEPEAPDLTWAAGRIDPEFLQQLIQEPQTANAGSAMPSLLGQRTAPDRSRIATELTHFVVSLGDARFRRTDVDNAAVSRGESLFGAVGCLACHSDPYDEIHRDGTISLRHVSQKYNVEGLMEFLEDPHRVRPAGGMPNMQLSHFEAQDLASYLMRDQSISEVEFELDDVLAEKGRAEFLTLGCIRCHKLPKMESNGTDNRVETTDMRSDRGCLSDSEGAWPAYRFDAEQRAAIVSAGKPHDRQYSDQERLILTLLRFNCLACHERDGLGRVAHDNEHFQTTDPNLGPQGRIPPTLTEVGAKLQPKWLRQVLVTGRSIRPYMLTRMPKFGTQNVEHLVELFHRVDGDRLAAFQPASLPDDKTLTTAGFELVSRDGLNCIACHTFQLKPADTMSAVDLTEMSERLTKTWFLRYMRNPQQLSPRTVMPSFWPGGRAIRPDFLDGNAEWQVEAIWRYLADGRQAREPQGLVREPMQLLATDEAVMLRRSWPQVGKRGIGVGYPSQVNLVFDAEQLRLATLWRGGFADPSGVWRSQGHGVARPLARQPFHFAVGPDLDDADEPWTVDEGRPPNHQFLGYELDSLRRPTFRYRFEAVEVTDYLQDRSDSESGEVSLRRTVRFSSESPRPGVRFRLAAGAEIDRRTNDTFILQGVLEIHVQNEPLPTVVDGAGGQELQMVFDLPAGEAEWDWTYRWLSEEQR